MLIGFLNGVAFIGLDGTRENPIWLIFTIGFWASPSGKSGNGITLKRGNFPVDSDIEI